MRLVTVLMCAALTAGVLTTQGCGNKPVKDEFDMGEKVRVGPLTYNVIETTWKSQLGDSPNTRMPERNFLLVRVSVTNGGGSEQTVPALSIENASGDSYTELSDGTGVPGWFGLLRRLSPASTDDGWVIFDVPTNAYRLKLTELDSEGRERITYIKIPLSLQQN